MPTEPLKIKHLAIKAEILSSEVSDTTMDFPKASSAENCFYTDSKWKEGCYNTLQNYSDVKPCTDYRNQKLMSGSTEVQRSQDRAGGRFYLVHAGLVQSHD